MACGSCGGRRSATKTKAPTAIPRNRTRYYVTHDGIEHEFVVRSEARRYARKVGAGMPVARVGR